MRSFMVEYLNKTREFRCTFPLLITSAVEMIRGFVMTQGIAWGVNWITDGCVAHNQRVFLYGVLLFTISILFSIVAVYMNTLFWEYKKVSFRSMLREKIIGKSLYAEYSVIGKFGNEDLLFRHSENIEDVIAYYNGMQEFFGSFGKILGGYIVGVMLSWQLTIVILLFGLLKIFVDKKLLEPLFMISRRRDQSQGEIYGRVVELLTGLPFFRATAEKNKFNVLVNNMLDTMGTAKMEGDKTKLNVEFLSNLLEAFILLCVVSFGAMLSANHVITIGAFAAFVSLYDSFVNPYRFVSSFINLKKQYQVGCNKVFELLDVEELNSRQEGSSVIRHGDFTVELQDLCFSYNKEKPVLCNVCKDFNSGQITYITGASGAGKSTLLKVIAGLFAPESGAISIVESGEAVQPVETNTVTYVAQQPFLFEGTVFENVALCSPENGDAEKVNAALKKVDLSDLVDTWEDGLDHCFTNSGDGLSGGERCRFALARLFYKPTPIILLDEIFASVDNSVIPNILEAIEGLASGNRCVLFVTHREEWIPEGAKRWDMSILSN